ncbi:hypothetical protein [Flavobacterium sp. SM2513]|uniref:hypothetical protein n=1 Tax=Flavobacterium sp. SM2513 TaxID=3424766 RepID=UPI003D7F4B27
MKLQIKKIIILLLLGTAFVNCSVEEDFVKVNKNSASPIVKTIQYEQAGETFNRLKTDLKIERYLKTNLKGDFQARTTMDTLGLTIITDMIKQVTLGDYTSYTMEILNQKDTIVFYNLTIEYKNGESSMFVTKYIPDEDWLINNHDSYRGGVISKKVNTLTQCTEPEDVFDDDLNGGNNNHDIGIGVGGGSFVPQPNYPSNCNGIIIVTMQMIPFQCGCGHLPNQGCNGCNDNTPTYPGYNLTTYYYCQEYGGGYTDNPSNGGGPSNPFVPIDTSIAAMIKPEECKERIVGDLNKDCMLSPYEMCMLNDYSTEVCDCVEAGGNLDACMEDEMCKGLNKISNSPDFADRIAFLKTKAAGSKEHAWVYKYLSASSTNFGPPTVAGHNTANQNTVNLGAFNGAEWLGAFHNHTNGEKPTIKMFSPEDISWLFRKAKLREKFCIQNIRPLDVSEIFLGLVNVNEVYCLKVKDWNKFSAFAPNYIMFKAELERLYQVKGANASQIEYQKVLLHSLLVFDMGVGLFDLDENGIWKEINLDLSNTNNTPIKKPCN